MTGALLKKQMLESFAWVYMDRKTGKRRSVSGLLMNIVLYLFVFGILGSMFYMMALSLCEPLVEMNLGWLYMAIMSLIAVMIGVFGSMFSTSATLYQAKDNDLLLSLPIPTGKILAMRLSGVYVLGLLYELIAMVPVLYLWFTFESLTLPGILFSLLLPVLLSVFILTLSCIVGWVVAKVSSRVKNKSFVTVVMSLGFIALYYYFYFQAYNILMNFLAEADTLAANAAQVWNPLYHLGLAAKGNGASMLIFTGVIMALFALVCLVLRRSFLKMATGNRGETRIRYKETVHKAQSAQAALLRKEWKRFTGSAVYMLNCGLGCIFLLAAGVALLLKQELLLQIADEMLAGHETLLPLLATAAVCMMSTMNDMTAPSVSLEGKNIWIVQVLPVSGWQVLKAKLTLHLTLTLIPTAFLIGCVFYVFRFDVLYSVLLAAVSVLFILFMAELGLFMNLKMPNLNWTSETAPVKQSMSVMIALLGGWAIVIALGGLYFLCGSYVTPLTYMLLLCVALLGLSVCLLLWLKNKGAKIFASL